MGNAIVAFRNLIDTSTLSGGAWMATLPLTNIQNRVIPVVARSVNTYVENTQFDIDIGINNFVRVLSLINHSFSLDATYRITAANDAEFTDVVIQSEWTDVWPSMYNSLDLRWEAANFWDGKYLETELAGVNWYLNYILDDSALARYWRVEISDLENADGYVQVGRVFIGDGWQTVVNMAVDASIAWETTTTVTVALSGSEFFDVRKPYRVAKYDTDFMDEDEGYSQAYEIQRQMGYDGEMMFIYDPDDTAHALRRQFLGRNRSLSPIEAPYAGITVTKTSWEIKELI